MCTTECSNYKSKCIFKPENLEINRNVGRQENQRAKQFCLYSQYFLYYANMALYYIYTFIAVFCDDSKYSVTVIFYNLIVYST